MTKVLEGTWDEIAAHAGEWQGQRLRIEVLNGANEGEEESATDFSLAKRLHGRVGRVAFEPDDLASRAEEYFGKSLEEKHEAQP